MNHSQFRENILNIMRQKDKDFETRIHERNTYISFIANTGKEYGISAKKILSREHTKVGSHNNVSYSSDFIPVDQNGNTIGNEVFGNEDFAIAVGHCIKFYG